MNRRVGSIFRDPALVEKIKRRLPHLFYYAERDSSRAGRVGMEVGSFRERILVALLIYCFGRENVETEIPITEHEVDVKVFGEGVSIKTLTTSGRRIGGVKAIWTVDAKRSTDFVRDFRPRCDYLVAHVVWNHGGGLYHLPVEAQTAVFESLGRDRYLRLPREGTNPRGVEITAEAMQQLVVHPAAQSIPIDMETASCPVRPV